MTIFIIYVIILFICYVYGCIVLNKKWTNDFWTNIIASFIFSVFWPFAMIVFILALIGGITIAKSRK